MQVKSAALCTLLLSFLTYTSAFAPSSFGSSLRLRQGPAAHKHVRGRQTTAVSMQERGGNRDRIFPRYKESLERAKELDKANSGDGPSVIMREKKLKWPPPFGFLNTLKEKNPQGYKAFQLAWFLLVLILWWVPFY